MNFLRNYAANNLVAGWSRCGRSMRLQHALKDKKFLLIDDEAKDWQAAFKMMFGSTNHCIDTSPSFISNISRNETQLHKELCELLPHAHFVLLDLYLTEHHDRISWRTRDDVLKISGFKVFKLIKKVDPAIPVIMFTTSQKIWNYKELFLSGVDEWWIKDNRKVFEKKKEEFEKNVNYLNFQEAILHVIDEPYPSLRHVWRAISDVRKAYDGKKFWWNHLSESKEKKVYEILERSFIALRRMLATQSHFEEVILGKGRAFPFDAYSCSSIVQQIGNIPEILYKIRPDKNRDDPVIDSIKDGVNQFLFLMRNKAAHVTYFSLMRWQDALICLEFACTILVLSHRPDEKTFPAIDRPSPKLRHLLLWDLISFYNCKSSHSFARELLKERIVSLTDYLFEEDLRDKGEKVRKLGKYSRLLDDLVRFDGRGCWSQSRFENHNDKLKLVFYKEP